MKRPFGSAVAAWLAAIVLVTGCSNPDASVKVGEFTDTDTAFYLILSDQLQRIRNVELVSLRSTPAASRVPMRVCVGVLPGGPYMGIAPASAEIVDRLRTDKGQADLKLDVVSSFECLVHYTRDDGPFQPEVSEALGYAGQGNLALVRNPAG